MLETLTRTLTDELSWLMEYVIVVETGTGVSIVDDKEISGTEVCGMVSEKNMMYKH